MDCNVGPQQCLQLINTGVVRSRADANGHCVCVQANHIATLERTGRFDFAQQLEPSSPLELRCIGQWLAPSARASHVTSDQPSGCDDECVAHVKAVKGERVARPQIDHFSTGELQRGGECLVLTECLIERGGCMKSQSLPLSINIRGAAKGGLWSAHRDALEWTILVQRQGSLDGSPILTGFHGVCRTAMPRCPRPRDSAGESG